METLPPYLQFLLNFGILGLVVLGFVTGYLFTKNTVEDIKESHRQEIVKLEKERDTMVAELKHALELERQRSEIGITAGTILRDIAVEVRKELKP